MKNANCTKALTFWSWNGIMDREAVLSQMHQFAENEMGVVIHSRAGLSIPYMGREWFEIYDVALQEAEKLGIEVIIYDEDGWPSGFAGGLVPALGEDYQAKNLKFSGEKDANGHLVAVWRKSEDGYRVISFAESAENDLFCYYTADPNYVDLLSEETVRQFIRVTHEKYRETFAKYFGSTVKGFFTDEPQLRMLPWSASLEAEWKKRYSSDLRDSLYLLTMNTAAAKCFKYRYRRVVSDVFYRSFTCQLANWCQENNLSLTGHFAMEDGLYEQMCAGSGTMRHYAAMQMPGIDHLGNRNTSPVLCKQVSSVATQFDRNDALSETFGCAGWNVSFKELYSMWSRQAALGMTKPCFHLSAYSIAGRRKRDYPAFYSYQEPWWAEMKDLTQKINSLNTVMKTGQSETNVLVISPLFSVAANYGTDAGKFYSCQYRNLIENLLDINCCFDLGDENIIESNGHVVGKQFCINQKAYDYVFVAQTESLTRKTADLLQEFSRNGGAVWSVGANPMLIDFEAECPLKFPVMQNRRDLIEKWFLKTALYRPVTLLSAKNGAQKHGAIVNVKKTDHGKVVLIWTGADFAAEKTLLKFDGVSANAEVLLYDTYTEKTTKTASFAYADKLCAVLDLKAEQSIVLFVNEAETGGKIAAYRLQSGEFIAPNDIALSDVNSFTLDHAAYSVADGAFSEEMYVLDAIDEIYARRDRDFCNADMPLKLKYTFEAKYVPQNLTVALEDEFAESVFVNGNRVTQKNDGYFVDKCIHEYPIAAYTVCGKNEIVLSYTIENDHKSLLSEEVFETEKNRFFFKVEPDSIYLRGDFSVSADRGPAVFENCCFAENFVMDSPVSLSAGNLTENGYLFYRGNAEYGFSYDLKENSGKYELSLVKAVGTAATIRVNGQDFFLCDITDKIDISVALKTGINEISVRLLGTNRNLLGPHHHIKGVTKMVGFSTFAGKKGFEDVFYSDIPGQTTYTASYSFIPFGLDGIQIDNLQK